MKTFEKGTVTELEVQLALVKAGYKVFTPVNEGCRIDLIFIDDHGKCSKVQVKKASKTSCGISIELRYSINKNRTEKGFYTPKEIDFFATFFENKLYLVPINEVIGRNRIVLRLTDSYQNQNIPMYAEDYEVNTNNAEATIHKLA